ncbi:MAG: hypothetical protein AMXMBFR13_07960 [Phycisphaerae bacterium]
MTDICGKCGGRMESGVTTVLGLIGNPAVASEGSKLVFIVPGAPASANPIKAFAQGLADQPSDRIYRIQGMRCGQCGYLALYAT